MAVNINVNPAIGNACMGTPVSLTFQDTDGSNYGRSPKTQKFAIKTFGDYNRTSPLGTDKIIWVQHEASNWRILKIRTKTSEPTATDFSSITKTVPTSGGSDSSVPTSMSTDQTYWIYGISNSETINIAGVSNVTISDFKCSLNNSAWTSKDITASGTNRTITLPTGYGVEDTYYFKFMVTVNTSSSATITVFANTQATSEAVYAVSTTETGRIIWTPSTLNLNPIAAQTSQVSCSNNKDSACTLEYINNGYTISPAPTTIASGGSATMNIHANTSNYSTYTDSNGTFLMNETSNSKSLGSIRAKIGTDYIQTCNINQNAGNISSKSLVINGTDHVTLNKLDGSAGSVTVSYVSKAYMGDTSIDEGAEVWITGPTSVSNISVSINQARKEITFTTSQNRPVSGIEITFVQKLYDGTVQNWTNGLSKTITVDVSISAKPMVYAQSITSVVKDQQGGSEDYILQGTLGNDIVSNTNARNEFLSDVNNGNIMVNLYDSATAGYIPYTLPPDSIVIAEGLLTFTLPISLDEQPHTGRTFTLEFYIDGPSITPTYYDIVSNRKSSTYYMEIN